MYRLVFRRFCLKPSGGQNTRGGPGVNLGRRRADPLVHGPLCDNAPCGFELRVVYHPLSLDDLFTSCRAALKSAYVVSSILERLQSEDQSVRPSLTVRPKKFRSQIKPPEAVSATTQIEKKKPPTSAEGLLCPVTQNSTGSLSDLSVPV